MSLAIGIDLGTTNSCVAVVREGKARVVQDAKGVALHPSVVSFHPDGRVLVSTDAGERRVIDPQNTFYSVKRLIGRDFNDGEVKRMADRYPYTITAGPKGIPLAQARGKEYTLPEISSMVLSKLRDVAAEAMGEEAGCTVITVPANFNDVQRSSTRVAGRIAGLDVQRILNEPTAAALAYGYGQGLNERIAVYDFGGGTFDITILDLRDNVFEVMATAGDMFLGGDDLDSRLVDQMVASFLQLHHVDIRDNPIALQRLRGVGEQIKRQLSSRTQVSARIRELEYGPGGKPLDMNFSVTRDAFEQRIMDLIDRSFMVCDEAFRLASMSPSQLDNVILVGGTTRMPLVRERVAEYFGMAPRADINPDEVVAIGAAIQAFALSGQSTSSTAPPAQRAQDLGRPIGSTPEQGEFDVAGGTQPGVGDPRSTHRGMPSVKRPGSVGRGASVGPGAAAAFGGALPDDLPSPRGAGSSRPVAPPQPPPQQQRRPPASAAPAQNRGAFDGSATYPSSPPGASSAAAAFGGGLPDDLPSPRQQGGGRSDLPAPVRGAGYSPDLPAPVRGGTFAGGADLPAPVQDTNASGLPAPVQGGGWGSDLPSPAGQGYGGSNLPSPAGQGYGRPDLPSPARGPQSGQSNLPTPYQQQGAGGAGLPRPASGGAAAAFGGAVPDNLPGRPGQPLGQPPSVPGGAAAAVGGALPDDLPGRPETSTSSTSIGDFTSSNYSLVEGSLSEESVVGSFTEEVMAPAMIGRPPPDMFGGGTMDLPAPSQRPAGGDVQDLVSSFNFDDAGGTPDLDFQSSPPLDEDGSEWDVLSMPGSPQPQVTPSPVQYVDSAVQVMAPQMAQQLASAGVQAPGVAPLPSQLLNELGVSHILIDVTPRTLAVQTVQGYCDPIIERNSPIPIEQSRVFTTSRDDQVLVNIRICQGESRRVEENTILGEVVLSGIRPAARGDVRIGVTFEIDTDGIVQVSARDEDTGQQAVTTVSLLGGMSDDEVRDIVRRYGR